MEGEAERIRHGLFSCAYVAATLAFLRYTGWLYNLGRLHSLAMLSVLVVCDLCNRSTKNRQHRKASFNNGLVRRVTAIILASLAVYFALAVLYGAPLLEEQLQTLMFASYMTVFTTVHSIVHLGAKETVSLMGNLGKLESPSNQTVLRNVQATLLGAWCSTVVIPLDWNRPWQAWPIPCCVGAMLGFFVGNAASVVSELVKFGRTNRKKPRCV